MKEDRNYSNLFLITASIILILSSFREHDSLGLLAIGAIFVGMGLYCLKTKFYKICGVIVMFLSTIIYIIYIL
ncbi:hypothetical protein HLPCO_002130 [Haloplasma contractile SSD-17B]|uniref:Uncharacterized protein n=1 Tax=Haloplasma contractile SSD-17B TaxID=1033810 RepID=F7PWH0_9MOLU|nr:hypothetical protein HLPCO_002130 [Haloplasma contractile SSD-17B]